MEVFYEFDMKFFKCLLKLLDKIFSGGLLWTVFFMLLLLRLIEEYLVYQVGLITSAYYKFLSEKNFNNFCIHTAKSFGLLIAISVLVSSRKYVTSVLYATWRENLTDFLHRQYFKNHNCYDINVLDKSIDNPDQRITQDVDKMCLNLSNILPTLLISPFTIAYYIYSCYMTTGWLGPVGVFAYFLVGTCVNKVLMSYVSHFVYMQEKLEGVFRYKHMHVRVNAEPIAFQSGEKTELTIVNKRLDNLIKMQQRLFSRQLPLDFSVNLFAYFGSILSFVLIAGPIFNGFYDNLSQPDLSALISKNGFVSIYLISCFSGLVALSEPLAAVAGTTHRISQLQNFWTDKHATDSKTRNGDSKQSRDGSSRIEDETQPALLLEAIHLTLTSPGPPWNCLVHDLSFQIHSKGHLLISGQSGCGKTTLLRHLKGLLEPSSGTYHFHVQRCLFLPQKTLLTDGTLRQQLLYPHWKRHFDLSDEDIFRYLEHAELSNLVSRAGGLDHPVEWDWYDSLSPGEAQRLCFLRLFCQRPTIAFLDEALSAVSPELEEKLYQSALAADVTLVSVGHRPSLARYHKRHLQLHTDCSWTLTDVNS